MSGVRTIDPKFWRGRRVLVTGHTGFKGSWLTTWLDMLGAQVTGVALAAEAASMFELLRLDRLCNSLVHDIREGGELTALVRKVDPEIVFHMAAQPLVRLSYDDPVTTYETNVIGTVNVLEACRRAPSLRSVVVVTTDKCYENREWTWPYRETDRLGGHDPYSNSKACTELVVAGYRTSFFNSESNAAAHSAVLTSVRAGNVIGGGDWSTDRLIPDIVRAIAEAAVVSIRSPDSVRPWQHVIDPLRGYLLTAQHAFTDKTLPGAFNFGPLQEDTLTVAEIVARMAERWGPDVKWRIDRPISAPHEARMLRLDSSLVRVKLGWTASIPVDVAIHLIVDWHRAHFDGNGSDALLDLTRRQIAKWGMRE